MTADEFVAVVKKGSDKLRVDDIVLNTGEREIQGRGMLRITQEKIELDMTLNAGETGPLFKTGIFTTKDFWRINGVIEDHLRFKCGHVSPHNRERVLNGRILPYALVKTTLIIRQKGFLGSILPEKDGFSCRKRSNNCLIALWYILSDKEGTMHLTKVACFVRTIP